MTPWCSGTVLGLCIIVKSLTKADYSPNVGFWEAMHGQAGAARRATAPTGAKARSFFWGRIAA